MENQRLIVPSVSRWMLVEVLELLELDVCGLFVCFCSLTVFHENSTSWLSLASFREHKGW